MMKRLFLIVATASLLVSFALIPKTVHADGNLIPNPSVEIVSSDPSLPLSWNKGSLWGDLDATYTYETTGQNGSRSLSITITRFNSGDAKWYFDPIIVEPNKTYTFSDYYKANINSTLVLQIEDTAGNLTFPVLGSPQKSVTWKPISYTFTTPANAKKLTVFHLINRKGYLKTDNFNLTIQPTTLIPNPSVETVDSQNPQQPQSWAPSNWGTNTPSFSYLQTGHSGSRSIKLVVSNYSDGDAKWYYTPQPVIAGAQYQFSDYYQSNITSRVVVWVVKADGTDAYVSLHPAGATANGQWQLYSDKFAMPFGAVTASVFHLLDRNGSLTTDDFSLQPITYQGFNRGLASINFDDGWKTAYTNALPLSQQYGFHSTQFLVTSFLNTPDYLTTAQAQSLFQAGNEIGSHTVHHYDLTTLSSQQVTSELSQAKQTLENIFGVPITNFASPYGAYDSSVITQIRSYYGSHRSTDTNFNAKNNFDVYNIKTQIITNTTSAAEVDSWVNSAKTNKTWLVLVYHQVDNSGDQFSTTPTQLNAQFQKIQQSGLAVKTMKDALAEILPQI